MIRPCPKCGKINSNDSLWCINCNTKLYQTINEPLTPSSTNADEVFTKEIKPIKYNHSHRLGLKLFLFTIITIGIVGMLITSLSFYLNQSTDVDALCEQLGENLSYADGKIVTADGITYNVSGVKEYKLNGRIQEISINDEAICDYTPLEFLTNILNAQDSNTYNCSLSTVYKKERIDLQILCNSTEEDSIHDHLNEDNLIFLNCEDKAQLKENISVDDEIIIEGTLLDIENPKIDEQSNNTTSDSEGEIKTGTAQVIIVEKVTINKSNN